jgi:hypothetical protein
LGLVTTPTLHQPTAEPAALLEPAGGTLVSDPPLPRRADDACPRCHEPCGRLTLLTSMVRYYTCVRCARPWQIVRELEADRHQATGRGAPIDDPGRQCEPARLGPRRPPSPRRIEVPRRMRDVEMPVTMNVPNVASIDRESSPIMIPGKREAGALTRFAVSHPAVDYPVDVTLGAATIADRQREGGGAPSERRPISVSGWTALKARFRTRWSRGTPAPATSTATAKPV